MRRRGERRASVSSSGRPRGKGRTRLLRRPAATPNHRAAAAGCSPNAQRGGLASPRKSATNPQLQIIGVCVRMANAMAVYVCVCKGASIITPSRRRRRPRPAPQSSMAPNTAGINKAHNAARRSKRPAHPNPACERARPAGQSTQEATSRGGGARFFKEPSAHARPPWWPLCRPSIGLVWDRIDMPRA